MNLLPCLLPLAALLDGLVDVTASRQVPAGASEAVFSVNVSAPVSTGLAQVAAKLEPVGVRAEHLRTVSVQETAAIPRLGVAASATASYSFEVRVPAAQLETLSLAMDQLFRQPPPPLTGFSFSAQLAPTAAALESARLAVLPALFEEARAKAEAAFAAAGQTPGPVVALRDDINSGSDNFATVKLSLRMARLGPVPAGTASHGRSVLAAATKRLTVPFDIAVISVGASKGAEQTLRVLAPLGVAAADVVSQNTRFSTNNPFFDPIRSANTRFEFTRPVAELVRFIDAFAKLPLESRGELGLSFSASLDHSAALQASEREKAMAGLFEDAWRRAEPLARLLNLPLGLPRNIADGESVHPPQTAFFAATVFDFLVGFATPSFNRDISLTVEFAVD